MHSIYEDCSKGLTMLLNKYNIDTCSSLSIGNDAHGNLLKIRIDKLTIVSSFTDKFEMKYIYSKLKKIFNNRHKRYSIFYIKNKEDMPYRSAILIRSKCRRKPVILRIDYSPINKNTGGIRLDFHPQHLTSKKIDHLISWMNKQLGGLFHQLLSRAWITQIDIALDLYSRRLDDYIWGLQGSASAEPYDEPQGLPGIRVGSKRSKVHILCYEKINLGKDKDSSYHRNSKFINVNLSQHESFLRIESRYRPNAKPTSNYGNPLMLSHLNYMENAFNRLQIYSKDLAKELLEKGYVIKIPREPSINALKKRVLRDMNCSRLPRRVQKIFDSNRVYLFDIDAIWKRWPLYIKQLSSITDLTTSFTI